MPANQYSLENCTWLQTQHLKQGQSLAKQKVINITKQQSVYGKNPDYKGLF